LAVTLIATVTNTGRQRHASGLVTGKSFQITHFGVGTEGADPGDPSTAVPPDPSLTELPGQVFGPEPIDGVSFSSPTCPVFEANIERAESNGVSLSSLVLYATIVSNGSDPVDEAGDMFPYAIAHFPSTPKTAADLFEYEVGIQV
jgi:hypothetical protein